MAQSGYTPILIYASGTATNTPLAANLTSSASGSELAINYADGKLFYKDNSSVVQTIATKGTAILGGSNTQIQYNNSGTLAGSANLTFDGTNLAVSGSATASAFLTGSGVTASTPTATPVTLFSLAGATSTILVTAYLSNGSAPTLYTAVSLVRSVSGVCTVSAIATAASMVITLSGTNVQATQSSGANQTILYSYIRIA